MDFSKSVSLLGSQTKEITQQDLIELFSTTPPEELKNWQIYGVGPTFFCYLYEQLGSEKFLGVYKRLVSAGMEDTLLNILDEEGGSTENWNSSTFLDSYLSKINDKIKANRS